MKSCVRQSSQPSVQANNSLRSSGSKQNSKISIVSSKNKNIMEQQNNTNQATSLPVTLLMPFNACGNQCQQSSSAIFMDRFKQSQCVFTKNALLQDSQQQTRSRNRIVHSYSGSRVRSDSNNQDSNQKKEAFVNSRNACQKIGCNLQSEYDIISSENIFLGRKVTKNQDELQNTDICSSFNRKPNFQRTYLTGKNARVREAAQKQVSQKFVEKQFQKIKANPSFSQTNFSKNESLSNQENNNKAGEVNKKTVYTQYSQRKTQHQKQLSQQYHPSNSSFVSASESFLIKNQTPRNTNENMTNLQRIYSPSIASINSNAPSKSTQYFSFDQPNKDLSMSFLDMLSNLENGIRPETCNKSDIFLTNDLSVIEPVTPKILKKKQSELSQTPQRKQQRQLNR